MSTAPVSTSSTSRRVWVWRSLALAFTAAFLLLGMIVQDFTYQPRVENVRITSDGFVTAALDDLIGIRAFCPGKVAIRSGYTTVANLTLQPGGAVFWHVLGDDQYEIRSNADCVKEISVSHRIGSVNPLWTGFCFLLAALCACWFALLFVTRRREDETVAIALWPGAVAFIASFGAYLIVPPYFHNDEVGQNLLRNWGYRGWGYLDTVHDLAYELFHHGIYGLTQVQSFGKPILLPLIGMLTGFGISPYLAGSIQSALLTALACAGLVTIAYWVYGRLGATVAGVIFTLNPIVLAYSTSFYQECGWLCGLVWAAIFAHRGLKDGSRRWVMLSVLAAAAAISSKHLVIAPLTIALLGTLLLFLRHGLKQVVYYCAGCAVASAAISIFAWPFLWTDSGFRIPFVLGARITFDNVHGFTEPLYVRAFNAFWNGFQRITPLELALLISAAYVCLKRRLNNAGWLFAGLACAVGFTLPTSFFLQHYVLYAIPFIAMLGGLAAFAISRHVNAVAVLIAVVVIQAGWSALYYPYTGMAGIICLTPACSLERLGVAEPVYGLREAADWLQTNADPNDVVVSLAAPHVLQAYLDSQQVLYMPALPVAPQPQHEVLERLRARYVVGTAWSRNHLPAVSDGSYKLAYSTTDRFGAVQIYERRDDRFRSAALPDLTPEQIRRFVRKPSRLEFFGDGAAVRTISTIPGLIQISTLPPAPQLTLSDIGAGTIIVPSGTALSSHLAALYDTVGGAAGNRYSVYRIPSRESTISVANPAMARTEYNTIKGVVRVSARDAADVTTYGVNLAERSGGRFPDFASAGCVFGQMTRAPLIQTSQTSAMAIFRVDTTVLKECRELHKDVFLETGAVDRSALPHGTVFATVARKSG